jgi:hypothetical protein
MNNVYNDLLPFEVGQSHYSFTLHAECPECDVIPPLSAGHSSAVRVLQPGGTACEANLSVK